MRRLLAVGAVTVMIFAAIAVLCLSCARTVFAASGSGNLSVGGGPLTPGCAPGSSFSVCDQAVGTGAVEAVIGVSNTAAVTNVAVSVGAAPGLPSDFAANDFRITSNTCTGSLAANQGCGIGFNFSPTATGLRAAAFTVTDTQGDKLAIVVTGNGTNLAIAPPQPPVCTPTSLLGTQFTYCPQPVGGSSTGAVFTLTAGSAGPQTGISVALAAIPGLSSQFASGDFTITGTLCTGALNALASCTVTVEFTPKAAGLRSAALTATDSSGDVSTVYIAGNTTSGLQFQPIQGTLAAHPCPIVNPFQYCNEPVGGVTATQNLVVKNTSGAQITGLAITPNSSTQPAPDFTVQGMTCTTTLAVNAICTISVAFTPQGTGVRQGAIEVTDAQGDVSGFNLTGVGDDYNLQLVSGQASEVTVIPGGTVTFMAEVVPDNIFGQNGEKVTFTCPVNLPIFTTCAFKPCPASITPGTPVTFSIVLVTSSATMPAPTVTNPCEAASTANVPPGLRGPGLIFHTLSGAARGSYFASPAFLILALLGTLTLATGAAVLLAYRDRAVPVHALSYLGMILATAGFAAIVLAGCGGGGTGTSSATPLGVTNMTIQGNALDSNGDPLNAARILPTFTLDVVAH